MYVFPPRDGGGGWGWLEQAGEPGSVGRSVDLAPSSHLACAAQSQSVEPGARRTSRGLRHGPLDAVAHRALALFYSVSE